MFFSFNFSLRNKYQVALYPGWLLSEALTRNREGALPSGWEHLQETPAKLQELP